jgi:hypothetical protein
MPYYRRRGILDNILLGVNTALGIANFVGGMKGRQQTREAKDLDTAIKIAQASREMQPGQPVGGTGKFWNILGKQGIARQVTPEVQTAAGEAAVQAQFPGQAQGGRTSPGTPQAMAQEQAHRRGVASLPAGGAYIPAAKNMVGVLGPSGMKKYDATGLSKVMMQPKENQPRFIYRQDTNEMIPVPGIPTVVRPYTDPMVLEGARQGNRVALENLRDTNIRGRQETEANREVPVYDEVYPGLQVGTEKKGGRRMPAPKDDKTGVVSQTVSSEDVPGFGVSTKTSTTTKYKKGQMPGQQTTGFNIPGVGVLPNIPPKGKGYQTKDGTKIFNRDTHLLVIKPDGTKFRAPLPRK